MPESPLGQHQEIPASHEVESAGHGGSAPVDGAMFFLYLLIFGIAATILKKKAFTPILSNLEAREAEIAQSLENADRLVRELSTLDEKVRVRLEDTEQKVRQMIDSGREAAREAAKIIEEKAREEALILRENAERELAAAVGKARNELRLRSAETAVELTAQLLHSQLDDKTRQSLTDRLIQQL